MAAVRVSPCRRMDFDCFFFLFFFVCLLYNTAIVKGVIALNVACLKRWKQELLDAIFCLDC